VRTVGIQPAARAAEDRALPEILPVLPGNIRCLVSSLPESVRCRIEEIRIRQERPLTITLNDGDVFLDREGRPVRDAGEAYQVTSADMERLIGLVSGSSLYAFEEELKSGFITLPGGHRVGLAGKALLEGGKVRTLKYISSVNIRVSREIRGAAEPVLPYIIDRRGAGIYHTLIVSPPRCGKTTMLRDMVRQISDGISSAGFQGLSVGLVDERSEIAGCFKGVPQRDVGMRTDVLDGCPKAEGMMMLLRAMSPRVIAVDEIGKAEDAEALEEVLNAGVKILASAHGSSLEELAERPVLSGIIGSKTVERFIILGRSRGAGTLEDVIDGKNMRSLVMKKC